MYGTFFFYQMVRLRNSFIVSVKARKNETFLLAFRVLSRAKGLSYPNCLNKAYKYLCVAATDFRSLFSLVGGLEAIRSTSLRLFGDTVPSVDVNVGVAVTSLMAIVGVVDVVANGHGDPVCVVKVTVDVS